jgi:RNA polymerase sigma-70 factor (ECF subfamily)
MLSRVRKSLDDLPDDYREVLVLRHLEQLSTRETADVLGITEGAAKMRHMRAMQRLQERLDTGEGQP